MIHKVSPYIPTICAAFSINTLHEGAAFWYPIAMRVGFLILIPTLHYVFHKVCHTSIHLSAHHIKAFGYLTKRFKYIPDILMIGALIGLHLFTEGGHPE
jgi:hypothetical protein